jgi:hypothetical protein
MGGRGGSSGLGGGSGGANNNTGGGAPLRGSEAQVRWATDIRQNVNRTIDSAVSQLRGMGGLTPAQEQARENSLQLYSEVRDRVNSVTQASSLIDAFRGVDFSDFRQALAAIQSVGRRWITLGR